MIKNKKENRNYILTPISSATYNSNASLTYGFSKVANFSKKGLIALISIFALLAVMFVGTIQTTKPAHADWVTDSFCNNGIKSLYSGNGNGFVPFIPTVEDAKGTLLRSSTALAASQANFPLTAFEEYGLSLMSYTSWVSATVDSSLSGDEQKFSYIIDANNNVSAESDAKNLGKIDAKTYPAYWSANIWDCTNASGAIVNGIANTYLSVSKFGVSVVNTIYLMVFGGGNLAFKTVYEGIGGLVEGLQNSFFMPYLQLMIVLGAIWMAYQGLIKRRSTEALQGAIWMIAAAITGTLLIANPLLIPNLTNAVVTTINKSINDAITSNPMSTATESNALCQIDAGQRNTATYDLNDAIRGESIYSDGQSLEQAMSNLTSLSDNTRETQCLIWYNILYTPWVAGQYGTTPPNSDAAANDSKLYVKNTPIAKQLVENGAVTLGNKAVPAESLTWPLLQLDSQKAISTLGIPYYNTVSSATAYAQLVEANNGTWAGKGLNMERPSAAFASIFAMLGTGILIVVYGLEMLAYQLGMLFLIILMPVFLLVGVHPGLGRRIALRWAELIGNLAIKQIIIGILLSIFLMIYGLVLGGGLWLIQNILIIAVTIVGLTYKKTIMNLFASLQFGGTKVLDDPMNQIIQGGKRVAGAVVGAGVGAAAAGVGMGKIAAAGIGGVAQTATSGSGTTPSVEPAIASEATPKAVETKLPPVDTKSPEPIIKTPEGAGAPIASPVSKNTAEELRIKQLKRETMKKAIWMGASQGFASGKIGTTAFTAAQLGLQIGDNAYDNEVAYQENLRDDMAREQERQVREAERKQREEANIARQEEIKAAQEAKAKREEELNANLREFNKNFRNNMGGKSPDSK